MKRISLLVCVLMLVSSASAQTTWNTYTVKDEQFSVALPALPTIDYRRVQMNSSGVRLEISLGLFADGVLYIIRVENSARRQSLDSFIKQRALSAYPLNRKTERKLTVDSAAGKTFSFDGMDGAVQFFSKGDRHFQFMALGASEDDVRLKTFFSSISLGDYKHGIEVPDPPRLLPDINSGRDAPEQIFTPQEVDKKFQPVIFVHPEYTELARQNRIEGTVVLKVILAGDGTVRNIRVVTGLPYGLTETAIACARRLRFFPAMKDGKYVSISTQLVYNFNLF